MPTDTIFKNVDRSYATCHFRKREYRVRARHPNPGAEVAWKLSVPALRAAR